jgi:asparagine synthase (glutamine-hydrolysing)
MVCTCEESARWVSGIAGIIDPSLDREQGEVLLTAMLESIRHRGPDHSGRWIEMPVLLGHNRLSITDPSPAAHQPMEFGDLTIVYDGEVYNYQAIRDELTKKGHRFRTNSDTEVILAAYAEWGSACVSRFVGMWAFAIWDKRRRELFCSRDRFGIKPFYYIHAGDKFYFGSEYKALKVSPLFCDALNDRQIARGLFLEFQSYRDETYFECLKGLPERTNLLFKDGAVSLSEYWDIDPARRFRGSFADKKERFLELFRNSVRLQMPSDVGVGGCLSGGLDSGSIASVVGKDFSGRRYTTITVYYENKAHQMDERRWVREVATAFPNIVPLYCSPCDDEVRSSLDRITWLHDAPLRASSSMSFYFIMKLAAQTGLKVMLDGMGADSYLAGSSLCFERLIGGYLRKTRIVKAFRALYHCAPPRSDGRRDLARRSMRTAVRGEPELVVGGSLRARSLLGFDGDLAFELREVRGSRLKRYLYYLIFSNLDPVLHNLERMSMASGIEARVPFLDHRLVEFAYSLQDEDLLSLGQTKYILRASLEGFLPKAIAARVDKQGLLGREIVVWLRGPLRHLMESPIDFDRLPFLNRDKTEALIDGFKSGSNAQADLVWRLVSLNYWLKLNDRLSKTAVAGI